MKNEKLYKLRIVILGASVFVFLSAGVGYGFCDELLWSILSFVVSIMMAMYYVASIVIWKIEQFAANSDGVLRKNSSDLKNE